METVLFVHGKTPLQRLEPFLGKGVQVVALDIDASEALATANIAHKTAHVYPVPDSNKRTVDFLNSWSNTPLADGKTIKDAAAYNGFSFWWCMEQWLYYSFLYRDPLNKIIEAIDVVMTVLDTENAKNVLYVSDGTLYGKVIKTIAHKNQIPAQPIKVSRAVKERMAAFIRPWGIKQFLRLHAGARKLRWSLQRASKDVKKGKHVLAICSYRWKTVEHPALKKPELGDPYITPIARQLGNHAVTYVDIAQREYVGFGALKEKALSDQRHVLLEQYFSLGMLLETRRAVKQIRSAVNTFKRAPSFAKSWEFEGVNLWQLAAPQFNCYFTHRLEGHVLDYLCAQALLEHEQPDVVLYPCEGGDLAYVFFKLCADRNIPSVGLQHGTMNYSPLAVHLPEEMCTGRAACLPRPTKLLLYGAYYRDFLQRSSYPLKDMTVVGNLRYDQFIRAHALTKKAMAAKYNLPADKPVVLFATQILPYLREMEPLSRAIFAAVKELGLPLIVKQHPGEQSDAMYRALAKEYGLDPLIVKDASTLELLTLCDAVVGFESTLDYEAMILDKPVVVVNLGGRRDWLPFVEEGAAIGAYKAEDVLPALKQALFDKDTRAKLSACMRELVEAHCYKVDGKSAERAVAAIKELIA